LLELLVETDQFTVCGKLMDGKEAIDKAPGLNPDLILLDYAMPHLNGAETASVLKSIDADCARYPVHFA
jgi:DNA-binding NarL/FixJ family response regulator